MKIARLSVVIIGILIPILFGHGIGDPGHELAVFLFFGAFNAVTWGSVLMCSLAYRHPASVWFPSLAGFIPLGIAHALLNLNSDAQAAIALVFIPIYAVPLVIIGGVAGWIYDRRLTRRAAASQPISTLPKGE